MVMKKSVFIILMLVRFAYAKPAVDPFEADIQPAVFSVTLVMIHDVVDPPLASRYYAYCMLGADAIVSKFNKAVAYPSSYIKSFPAITIKENNKAYNYQVAAIYCIYESGKNLLPSGYLLEEKQAAYLTKLKASGIDTNIINQSVAVAKEVSAQIVNYSRTDNYSRLSTLRGYSPKKGDEYWFPTPPGYFEAVQPHWTTIRPMVIDSSTQFIPPPLIQFSKDSASNFHALAMEVYHALNTKDSTERVEIANYWDCNPFNLSTAGHMSIGFKKMSPGGHWMNIAAIASEQAKIGFDKSIQVQTITAITLMDAFISCWDEKYRSNRIRPETYINRYIDVTWTPILQTPPFPEYTSGHSMISSAAAAVLTYLLGDNFSFTDDSEVMFELPPRTFHSFQQAANEAALSRLYGGIHFRDSVENGQVAGKKVGEYVVGTIKKAGIKGGG